MTQIIPSKCPDEVAVFDNHLLVWRIDNWPAPFKLWRLKPEGLVFPWRYDMSIGNWVTWYGISWTFYEALSFQDLLGYVQIYVLNTNYPWLSIQIETINWVDWITLVGTPTIIIPVEDMKLRMGYTWWAAIIESTTWWFGKDISTILLNPEYQRFWPCKLVEIPQPPQPQWWSSLPVPKVSLSSRKVVYVRDYKNTVDVVIANAPTVAAMDLTQDQINQWVRLEFLYYRTSKGKTPLSKSNKAWFVHPSETDSSGAPIYVWATRWGIHNWVPMFRPSWLPVSYKNEQIKLWQMLNSRLAYTTVWYRDTTWAELTVQALIPIRRKAKYSNNVSPKHYYSTRYAPLYFCCRWAIQNPIDWTWISWPESKVYTLTNNKHPFKFNPTQSAILWLKCCNIENLYVPLELKVFAWPSRVPTP